jgi:hypothetical protein
MDGEGRTESKGMKGDERKRKRTGEDVSGWK